jgi:dinuclear metal center YbgI/SA1388 family protein
MDRIELELYLNNLLEAGRFHDYCPNGLQVEGRRKVERLATGVTASLELLEAALEWGADAVLVHHGYFWKHEPAPITGIKYGRLRLLLANDINLFAYHLPLDAHPLYGNNATLGDKFGWIADGRTGPDDLVWTAALPIAVPLNSLTQHIHNVLGREPLLIGDPDTEVRRVAWCTGAAQNFFEAAIASGADVYISGEISEQTTHIARESGVAYIAAGHHVTERYGVQALGMHIAKTHEISHRFFDVHNPV